MVVDASGRSGRLTRSLGTRRLVCDRLIGVPRTAIDERRQAAGSRRAKHRVPLEVAEPRSASSNPGRSGKRRYLARRVPCCPLSIPCHSFRLSTPSPPISRALEGHLFPSSSPSSATLKSRPFRCHAAPPLFDLPARRGIRHVECFGEFPNLPNHATAFDWRVAAITRPLVV